MTNQNAFKLPKCGIEGTHCKLRTKDFSIDTVRPKKTKFAFQEKKFQRSGITTDRRGVSR